MNKLSYFFTSWPILAISWVLENGILVLLCSSLLCCSQAMWPWPNHLLFYSILYFLRVSGSNDGGGHVSSSQRSSVLYNTFLLKTNVYCKFYEPDTNTYSLAKHLPQCTVICLFTWLSTCDFSQVQGGFIHVWAPAPGTLSGTEWTSTQYMFGERINESQW